MIYYKSKKIVSRGYSRRYGQGTAQCEDAAMGVCAINQDRYVGMLKSQCSAIGVVRFVMKVGLMSCGEGRAADPLSLNTMGGVIAGKMFGHKAKSRLNNVKESHS